MQPETTYVMLTKRQTSDMILLTKISRVKSLELLICLKFGLYLGMLLNLLLIEEEEEECLA